MSQQHNDQGELLRALGKIEGMLSESLKTQDRHEQEIKNIWSMFGKIQWRVGLITGGIILAGVLVGWLQHK